eukprot:6423273-Amphidinium_carterae.1
MGISPVAVRLWYRHMVHCGTKIDDDVVPRTLFHLKKHDPTLTFPSWGNWWDCSELVGFSGNCCSTTSWHTSNKLGGSRFPRNLAALTIMPGSATSWFGNSSLE